MTKNENSPSKPQRVLVEHESQTGVVISTPAFLSLARRAGKSKYSLTILEQIYCRGLLAAKINSKNTPEQQAFHRVDSFLHEGRAYELDQDLITETPKVPDGKKHMYIIKNAIKGHEERNKPEQSDRPVEESLGSSLGRSLRRGVLGGGPRRSSSSRSQTGDFESDVARGLHRRSVNREIKRRESSGYQAPAKERGLIHKAIWGNRGPKERIRDWAQKKLDKWDDDSAQKKPDTPSTKNRYVSTKPSVAAKQAEFKKSREASSAKGATYSGDTQTPEQKEAQRKRSEQVAAQANYNPKAKYDPNKKKVKSAFNQ